MKTESYQELLMAFLFSAVLFLIIPLNNAEAPLKPLPISQEVSPVTQDLRDIKESYERMGNKLDRIRELIESIKEDQNDIP